MSRLIACLARHPKRVSTLPRDGYPPSKQDDSLRISASGPVVGARPQEIPNDMIVSAAVAGAVVASDPPPSRSPASREEAAKPKPMMTLNF